MQAAADVAAAAELTRFYEIASEIPSGQSGFEAEMEARFKRQRHAPFLVYGDDGRIKWRDTGIRAGLTHVGGGDEGGGRVPELPDEHHPVMIRDSFWKRIARTLARADEMAPALRDPAWTCTAPPSWVLRLRFRELMPASRWAFDPSYRALRDQEKRAPTMVSVQQTKVRGPGNLAHLTPSAMRAWAFARTVLELGPWVDRLGRSLAQPVATVEARLLGRQVKLECELLELAALAAYRRGRTGVPAKVRRAALQR